MPRKSSADVALAGTIPTPIARLKPPADLPEGPERDLFLELVLSVRPDHFSPEDAVLLAAYSRACVLERVAAAELAAAGYVDAEGRPSGWHTILTQATRAMTTLSRILRLNPQSREPLAQQRQVTSYYERMSLEGSKRDEAEPEPN